MIRGGEAEHLDAVPSCFWGNQISFSVTWVVYDGLSMSEDASHQFVGYVNIKHNATILGGGEMWLTQWWTEWKIIIYCECVSPSHWLSGLCCILFAKKTDFQVGKKWKSLVNNRKKPTVMCCRKHYKESSLKVVEVKKTILEVYFWWA